jgi:hypothetical protein
MPRKFTTPRSWEQSLEDREFFLDGLERLLKQFEPPLAASDAVAMCLGYAAVQCVMVGVDPDSAVEHFRDTFRNFSALKERADAKRDLPH